MSSESSVINECTSRNYIHSTNMIQNIFHLAESRIAPVCCSFALGHDNVQCTWSIWQAWQVLKQAFSLLSLRIEIRNANTSDLKVCFAYWQLKALCYASCAYRESIPMIFVREIRGNSKSADAYSCCMFGYLCQGILWGGTFNYSYLESASQCPMNSRANQMVRRQ